MSDERVFDPTPQQLARARRDGRVARSASLTTVIVLLAGAACLWWYSSHLMQSLGWFLHDQLVTGARLELTTASIVHLQSAHAIWLAKLLGPLFGFVVGAAIVANVIQGGWIWAPQRITPDLSRLGPGPQLTAMFSLGKVLDIVLELAKMATCLGVAGWGLWRARHQLALGPVPLAASAAHVLQVLFVVLVQSLLGLGAVSLIEYGLTWWRHRRTLRMTAAEWQAEMKERSVPISLPQMRRLADNDSTSHDH